ncbi:MAG TPA: hypothetical protein VMZ53_06310 [Kofleriaceae bacterium]|nr:hypothetical protein [Kofleriaceae bacterium]
MRLRTISALLVGATVAAVLISSHTEHGQLANQARINRNASSEVLKFHAVLQARIDIQLSQPDLGTPTQAPDIWRLPPIQRQRVG